jgi:hypothetical protein
MQSKRTSSAICFSIAALRRAIAFSSALSPPQQPPPRRTAPLLTVA